MFAKTVGCANAPESTPTALTRPGCGRRIPATDKTRSLLTARCGPGRFSHQPLLTIRDPVPVGSTAPPVLRPMTTTSGSVKLWRLRGFERPSGLPVVVLLEPRQHFAEPGDLPDQLASELGLLIARVERAIGSIGEIGRVHACRWGDGAEHLHWWFMARPARLPQLVGSFVAIWDDILPPTPEHIWTLNLQHIAQQLRASE